MAKEEEKRKNYTSDNGVARRAIQAPVSATLFTMVLSCSSNAKACTELCSMVRRANSLTDSNALY